MVIKEERPLTLAEVNALVAKSEKADDIKQFLKHFLKLNEQKATELKEELTRLDIIKLKETHLVKLVDFLPESASELNKVLPDVSFDEEETTKILSAIKNY